VVPGASFVVNGAAQARDSALVTTAAEMKWLNGFSLAATFDGAFSDVTAATSARASPATTGRAPTGGRRRISRPGSRNIRL
jgi:hypothetical protein